MIGLKGKKWYHSSQIKKMVIQDNKIKIRMVQRMGVRKLFSKGGQKNFQDGGKNLLFAKINKIKETIFLKKG